MVGLTGCAHLDPTDDSNFASVSFRNNTAHNAELFTCQADGRGCHSEGFVPPGTDVPQRVAFGNFVSLFKVREEGRPESWLVLSLPRHTEGSVFWLSDASTSRTVPSPDHGEPHLKPTS